MSGDRWEHTMPYHVRSVYLISRSSYSCWLRSAEDHEVLNNTKNMYSIYKSRSINIFLKILFQLFQWWNLFYYTKRTYLFKTACFFSQSYGTFEQRDNSATIDFFDMLNVLKIFVFDYVIDIRVEPGLPGSTRPGPDAIWRYLISSEDISSNFLTWFINRF